MPDSVLSVRGDKIVDGSGQRVNLRGYNIGGWMNMENFLTGYPGTESQHRRVLRRVLGLEIYAAFFDRFMTVFFDDADARYLASLGMNSVRIPFNYRHFDDDARPFELKESGFALLDRAVGHCQRHGLYAVLDFHALPGSQNQHWHSDNETHKAGYLGLPALRRSRRAPVGSPRRALPGQRHGSGLQHHERACRSRRRPDQAVYDRAVEAVRRVDPDHIIFLDGNRYSTDFSAFENVPVYPNTVYTAHDYALPGFIYGGPYPGVRNGVFFDRDQVEQESYVVIELTSMPARPAGGEGPGFPGPRPVANAAAAGQRRIRDPIGSGCRPAVPGRRRPTSGSVKWQGTPQITQGSRYCRSTCAWICWPRSLSDGSASSPTAR